jgi:hypothetical protein
MPDDAHLPVSLIEKLTALPSDLIAEVERFVDALRASENDRSLSAAAADASAPAFAAVWNNHEDDVYDAL